MLFEAFWSTNPCNETITMMRWLKALILSKLTIPNRLLASLRNILGGQWSCLLSLTSTLTARDFCELAILVHLDRDKDAFDIVFLLQELSERVRNTDHLLRAYGLRQQKLHLEDSIKAGHRHQGPEFHHDQ